MSPAPAVLAIVVGVVYVNALVAVCVVAVEEMEALVFAVNIE